MDLLSLSLFLVIPIIIFLVLFPFWKKGVNSPKTHNSSQADDGQVSIQDIVEDSILFLTLLIFAPYITSLKESSSVTEKNLMLASFAIIIMGLSVTWLHKRRSNGSK